MAENQSAEHKEAYWRRVVLKWVKCAELTTSHDSFDLDTCYTNFRCKIEAYYELIENTVAEFLRVQFPHFELELSNENEVPKCDAVYVFSLMLYFSCIRYPIPYFQNVGQEFDVEYQRSMTAFLNSFVSKDGNQIIINRSFLDKAFQSAKPVASVLSEESSNRRVLSQQMITSTPSGKLEMRKPSPTTPKSVALEWKLKNLNALLETAQAENSSQERQIERLLQNMKKLQEEKKMYQSKINILQLKETCACGNNLTNLPNESNRVTEQLQKQLESKNQDIEMLQEELSKLKESANAEIERYTSMKKQYAVLEEDNQRMKIAVEDLREDISMKEACNQNLFEIVKDLRRFINENQIKGAGLMESLESSFEFLDQSFKNVASDDSHCYDSENLASTVVEIKLKEKEHELEAMTRKSQELEDKLKAHLEKQNHLQAEYNEKDAKLRQTLAVAEKEKSILEKNLEREKDKMQDLNQQLQERERLVAELNENTVQLRQALEKAEKEKSQLTVDLEEGKTFIEDLNNQLESQKKAHLEKYECLQAEMKQETAGLVESLAAAEKEKSTLVEDLEREKDKLQDLNRQLQERERLVAELNENTVQLRQAWEKAEKEKSQLTVDLEEGKTFIEDLNNQLESQKKAHLEKYECLQAEMKQETAGLLESLAAAEKEKSTLVEDLEREKDKLQDLNRQLQERERLVAELNENTVQLRQAWEKAEKEKSQLTVDLEEGKTFIEDLNNQLESQKKAHLEKYECLQAEMKQETAGLLESLAAAEKEKSTLVENLEREKDKMQDLNQQLQERERLVAELNENTVQLRQAWEKAEKEKSQLTVDLEEGKTFIEDLNNQLESQKKAHLEKYECLQAEMKQETAGLVESLAAAEKEKSSLVEDLEREKDKLQDLNRQLQERERLVAELNENTVQLRQAWEKAEKEKSQLTVDLEEGKTFIEDLNNQLESQKKAHLEKYECLQAEMKQETAGLLESLAAAEKEKSTLVENLEREKDKMQDLNQQLQERERLVAELNENTVQLRQAWEKAEKEKSQLTVDLEEGKTFIEDLNNQLESQKKAHLEKYECLQAEMKQETAGLVESLAAAEKEKSTLVEDLERGKDKLQDLNRQLQERERLVAELNENTVQLRQALEKAEKEKSQLTVDLEEGKTFIEDLNNQLELQKKAHLEKYECLQAEMKQETTGLVESLAITKKEKSQLAAELEMAKAKMQDLNRQLQEHERLQTEMCQKTVELRQALADAEKEKSYLTENLEICSRAKMEDLKQHEYIVAELSQTASELRKALAEPEQKNSQLTEDLEKANAKMEDLNRQLQEHERLVDELNTNTSQLQQALSNAEEEKSSLTEDIKNGKALIEDLTRQLEAQKKGHLESNERLQIEMDRKTEGLRKGLIAAEKEKSLIAVELEQCKAFIKELNNQLQDHEHLQVELNEKSAALAEVSKAKSQLDDDLAKEKSKTAYLNHQLELVEKTKLLHEQSSTCQRDEMAKQILTLQQTLDQEQEKSEEISCQHMQAKRQADDLGVQCTKLMQQLSADRSEMANLQQQLATKDAKLMEMSVLHEETVKKYEKAYQDGEIVAAKLYTTRLALKEKEELWAKERASMANAMEEKLRDARIEHDSKMAKMKDRMVELHKEVKTKLESENQGLLLTVEGYRRKVENLEIRCAKLQQQLAEMNERNLEVRKENQLLHIRIKSLDEFGNDRKSVLLPTQANLRNNFKMEDEEGELFNNMYLADLKSGRCVSPGGPSTTKSGLNRYSELSQRNSMVMPHLRTNYVALEPDCEPPQDDTRDNMSTTFDDSSTGLISRRKVSGITSYKRPGPPTPSKRAGRLSLSGALSGNLVGEVQYKEVLRDANANDAVGGGTAAAVVGPGGESAARTARTKTPGKFKQMISSSSLLNNFQRDEDNKCALPKGTAYQRCMRCATDTNIHQEYPPNARARFTAIAKQKRLQREVSFDSNRCLGENTISTLPYTVDERMTVPLGTILECPLVKDEQDQVFATTHCNTLTPEATVRKTTDYYSSRPSPVVDITGAAATTASITTTTTMGILIADATLVEPIPVSDYSFKHPYGSSRYNILRKQQLRRANRCELYDNARQLVSKGKPGAPVAISIASPEMDVNSTHHSMDMTTDHNDDITQYYSFSTVDLEDSVVRTVFPDAITSSRHHTTYIPPLFLLLAAWFGMLAMLMFCVDDR